MSEDGCCTLVSLCILNISKVPLTFDQCVSFIMYCKSIYFVVLLYQPLSAISVHVLSLHFTGIARVQLAFHGNHYHLLNSWEDCCLIHILDLQTVAIFTGAKLLSPAVCESSELPALFVHLFLGIHRFSLRKHGDLSITSRTLPGIACWDQNVNLNIWLIFSSKHASHPECTLFILKFILTNFGREVERQWRTLIDMQLRLDMIFSTMRTPEVWSGTVGWGRFSTITKSQNIVRTRSDGLKNPFCLFHHTRSTSWN